MGSFVTMASRILILLSLLVKVCNATTLLPLLDVYENRAVSDCVNAIESFFSYSITLTSIGNDCSASDLIQLSSVIDTVVAHVEQTYTAETGGEIYVASCGSEFSDDTGNSRNLGADVDFDHRKLGIYTRQDGGWCRRCGDRRRLQGNDQKILVEWLRGFEQQVADEIEKSLIGFSHSCTTERTRTRVDIQLLNDALELPC